jgi:hypothetical protein
MALMAVYSRTQLPATTAQPALMCLPASFCVLT